MTITERLSSLRGFAAFLAYEFTKDQQLQQDYAQEAMIAMWRELVKAEAEGREVNDSYLRYRARWTMLDLTRRAKALLEAPAVMGEVVDDVDQDHAPAVCRRAAVRDAVATLPPRQREYVYLRFWEGWSVKSELAPSGYNRHLWYDPQNGARAALRTQLR